ncbi:uncharacterized protein LOC112082938 [Eutrema salsugineum]|uniref:uncharacterized protein LOC112082938 n=1 Tax=Eutrema salsugineum TaxID=72664 RepID=UPI000CED14FD|nr:uncharacterized protein LOC112082938 [Eutrema salsugineum]
MVWDEFLNLSIHHRVAGKSWAVMGDFNQTLDREEHSSPSTLNIDRATRNFRDCLTGAGLSDLTFRGFTYTWWNKKLRSPIAKKLDRILVNDNWLNLFPSAYGYFGELDFSDHSSCGLVLCKERLRPRRAFRFNNYLVKNQEFLPTISEYWYSTTVHGSAMFRVARKLKGLKSVIRSFNKTNYSNLEIRVSEAHAILLDIQNQVLSNPSSALAEQEFEAHRKWSILAEAENQFLWQKACISWLKDGDSSTAYFHCMIASRKAANHIHFLLDNEGNRYDTQEEIQSHCIDYFEKLLNRDDGLMPFAQEDLNSLMNFEVLFGVARSS